MRMCISCCTCRQLSVSLALVWEDIIAPSASKAPVWKYFGYVMDLTSGRAAVGERATCKLCRVEVAHSGGQLISKITYVPTITLNTEICTMMIWEAVRRFKAS